VVPGLLEYALGELAQYPACLPLLGRELAFVKSLSLFAMVLALELVASAQNTE